MLTVLRFHERTATAYLWLCRCDCGAEKLIHGSSLKKLATKSCGCSTGKLRGALIATHGMSKSPEYRIWFGMRQRCENPKNGGFYLYGGRGITVCDRWNSSFEAFFSDMGTRPSSRHSIDRIDGNKGYYPENCRWANPREQSANTRIARLETLNGETFCVSEWSRRSGVNLNVLSSRLKRGLAIGDALALPVKPAIRYLPAGTVRTVGGSRLCYMCGVWRELSGNFGPSKQRLDGISTLCNSCKARIFRERRCRLREQKSAR